MSGPRRSIEATDGRRAFLAHSCQWPWSDDVLIERSGWFEAAAVKRAADAAGCLHVCSSGSEVCFKAGPWSLTVPRLQHRFPDVSRIVPSNETAESVLSLNERGRRALQAAIKIARRQTLSSHAVTLEVGERSYVRYQIDDETHEVVIGAASFSGQPMRVAVSLSVLDDFVRFGVEQLRLVDPHKPVWVRTRDTTYVAMPLHPDFITVAQPDANAAAPIDAELSAVR